MTPKFLDAEVVIEIHRLQLEDTGGLDGIRDIGLLDSALAQPMACFGGNFFHEDLFAMAAAYLFHIALNHPFNDGNKRTALIAALTFLGINGQRIQVSSAQLYDATMAVAEGRLDKDQLADLLRSFAGN